jgi:hypothetical protein
VEANLFFQLVSSRYDHASLILASNLPLFGDQTVAAAMIDRMLHHADVHTLKGSGYRLNTSPTTPSPASGSAIRQTGKSKTWPNFQEHLRPTIRRASTRRAP